MADAIFMVMIVAVSGAMLYLFWQAMGGGSDARNRRLVQEFPVGTKVRILRADDRSAVARILTENYVGLTGTVTGHDLYSHIESHVKIEVPVLPGYPQGGTFSVGFSKGCIEKVPDLTLVTTVELLENYKID